MTGLVFVDYFLLPVLLVAAAPPYHGRSQLAWFAVIWLLGSWVSMLGPRPALLLLVGAARVPLPVCSPGNFQLGCLLALGVGCRLRWSMLVVVRHRAMWVGGSGTERRVPAQPSKPAGAAPKSPNLKSPARSLAKGGTVRRGTVPRTHRLRTD